VGLCALFSALYLWKRDRRLDMLAHASAELGVLFSDDRPATADLGPAGVGGLVTGEVRLTSTLVLLAALRGLPDPAPERREPGAGGALLRRDRHRRRARCPIIYYSVEWCRGLHPKS